MKLSFNHEDLKKGLTLVCGVSPKNPRIEILGHIKIEVTCKDFAILCATNETAFLYRKIPLESCEAIGTCTVHGKKFLDLVKNYSSKSIVNLNLFEDHKLKISQSRSRYTFKTLDTFDFPSIKIPDQSKFSPLPADTFLGCLKKVESVTADDESKSVLQAVYIEETNAEGFIRAVATDGIRLLTCKTPGVIQRPLLVAKDSIFLLTKFLQNAKECSWYADESNVYVKTEKGLFCARLLAKQFPDYKKLFSTGSHVDITIELEPTRQALKRALLFSTKIIITIRPNGTMTMTGNSETEECEEEVLLEKEVKKISSPIKIAVNTSLFSQVLEKFEGDEITMKYYADLKPLILVGKPELIGLFMPLRV
jgi:DNA polymerase III beta subunit